MSVYFDTHTHLSYPLLNQTNSFALIVTTHADNWPPLNPSVFKKFLHAVGFHPWHLPSNLAGLEKLEDRIKLGDVDAIGEIGLDYSREFVVNKLIQLDYFKAQLLLAHKYGLPVSIHARKSLNDVLNLLKQGNNFGVIHGFGGSYEQAIEFLKLGFKIGVNGIVCYPKAVRYHSLIIRLSLSDIVLETDFPYVKNASFQPVLIDEVAIKVAKLKKCSVEEVILKTTETAKKIFLRNYKDEPSF